jgi:hypothetical protein
MNKKDLLTLAASLPDDGRPFAVAVWHRPHVIEYASEQGVELTPAQADEAVEILARRNDPEASLNFDGLGPFLEELRQRKAGAKFVATERLVGLLRKGRSTGEIIRLLGVRPSQASKVVEKQPFTRATAKRVWAVFPEMPKEELVVPVEGP